MNRQKSTRSSRGSRGSHSNTSADSDPREKMKDCCRKLIAFMFTQVGVGGLIVGYAICGAAIFQVIEKEYDNEALNNLTISRHDAVMKIWNATISYNTMDTEIWINDTMDALYAHQMNVTNFVRKRYDFRKAEDIWTFSTALMFCLSIFSMIGYGNCLPRTPNGKIMTMVYATFGIPLYILYFQNMGKVLASTFKWLYTWLHDCSHDNSKGGDGGGSGKLKKTAVKKKIIVPSTACLWVIMFYVVGGTVMFAEWEDWAYQDSIYFVVTSLCKIGFGDFVPGSAAESADKGQESKLIMNFAFILFGMGLVAMCYKLMREEVLEKVREMKEDAKLCLEDVTQKFAVCFGTAGRDDEYEERYY